MDDVGLEKIRNKIDENAILIKSLTKLLTKASAPKEEIRSILKWLKERQKLLKQRYIRKVDMLCEEVEAIAKSCNELR